jgi:hypothetical protein
VIEKVAARERQSSGVRSREAAEWHWLLHKRESASGYVRESKHE